MPSVGSAVPRAGRSARCGRRLRADRARGAGRRGAQEPRLARRSSTTAWSTRGLERDCAVDRARRRRHRRPHRLRRRDLPARRAVRAGADHAARAGRFERRRQDRGEPSRRQEPHRRLPSAAPRAGRRRHARRRCRAASAAPAWPRSSSTAPSSTRTLFALLEDATSRRAARSTRRCCIRGRPRAAPSRPRWSARTSARATTARFSTSATPLAHAIEVLTDYSGYPPRRGGRDRHGVRGPPVGGARHLRARRSPSASWRCCERAGLPTELPAELRRRRISRSPSRADKKAAGGKVKFV